MTVEELVVERADIEAARDRIAGYVRRTPVLEGGPGAFDLEPSITLKLEQLQHTGSFKLRGAFNKLLASDVPEVGVIAASGGNFGYAVAYAARSLGHAAEIFFPDTSPAAKLDRIRGEVADVRIVPGYFHEAWNAAAERQAVTGALAMHPYDQPEVVAGAGTIGMELAEQVADADSVIAAIGGGGLIAGIASWFRDDLRVVGAEPERCPSMHAALAAGEPVDVEVGGVAADSLGPRRVGRIAFEAVRRWVDPVVLVPDEAIRRAQRLLWRDAHVVAEPGGATALAALLCGAYRPSSGERVVVLISGANTDPGSVV